ncbi:MAG: bifunctional phosphoribosylaminoimidazolecarboxamide formyltransferase/IMP cyclohydrolase [Erysipelotrichales bacterium]|nr:bifunctional phosphoribosylaminoimidazolecarboxamide formyltransferase/IMP cyclohydrolase [Erysipelotrichales bacterium]
MSNGKKRALLSVSDKTGLIEFAKELKLLGFELISTGGTKKSLIEHKIAVIGIEEVTDFPEILDGRVKTLHPKVHGGLLARRDNPEDEKTLANNGISYIDLVVVNLYPFEETIKKTGVTLLEAIENIDIGGPSMLRSAAKNHASVTAICDPSDYSKVISELKEFGDTSLETKAWLAAKVFRLTSLYDQKIADYLNKEEVLTLTFQKQNELRYGENPHQKAAFYKEVNPAGFSLSSATQLHGKELSYNNINDAEAALNLIKEFEEPAAVVIKHMNPCGVGADKTHLLAFQKAYAADPISIFGGIVCFNGVVCEQLARLLSPIFLEIIIAESFSSEALKILMRKKDLRLLTISFQDKKEPFKTFVSVRGGLLVQDADIETADSQTFNCVTKRKPTAAEIKDLTFAMKVCKHVKSNAIVVAANGQSLGVGAGQMNRIGSAEIALKQSATLSSGPKVLASDAFFPFDDVVKMASLYQVKAIIQPGGSVRDNDSIKACDELGIAMVFTGIRHFRH